MRSRLLGTQAAPARERSRATCFSGPTARPFRGPGRESMARKLKSDKVLFMATLLLVCTSVVMVYSASAMLAEVRYQQQYWFLVKQAAWAILGVFLLVVTMRIDYRHYREPIVI